MFKTISLCGLSPKNNHSWTRVHVQIIPVGFNEWQSTKPLILCIQKKEFPPCPLQGQRIKQIVDQSRCRLLREGDILVEVDDKRVKEMSHLAVVQLLKECPVGQVTRILVQRQRPPTGPRPRPISTSSVDPELRKPPIASAPQPERSVSFGVLGSVMRDSNLSTFDL